jgi:heptosyltransferase-2
MDLLIRVPNWLGDLMMSVESLNGLVNTFPETAFWSHGRVSGLLPALFPRIPVIPLDERPSGFSRVLVMPGSFSSAWLAWKAGIPHRTGYRGEWRGMLLTRSLKMNRKRDHHHSADFEVLSRELGAEPAPLDLSGIQPEGAPHAAVFPGARYGSAKMWRGYPDLAARLMQCTGLPVTFYGTGGEKQLLTELSMSLPDSDIEAGLPMQRLCSRLKAARIAVGNDSGGVHLSAALGVPTVTIFGSTSPVWTAPKGKKTRTVYMDRFCSPCFRRRCPGGEQPPCLQDISTGTVMNSCLELLEE